MASNKKKKSTKSLVPKAAVKGVKSKAGKPAKKERKTVSVKSVKDRLGKKLTGEDIPTEFYHVNIDPEVYSVMLANYLSASPSEMSGLALMLPAKVLDSDGNEVDGYEIVGYHAAAVGGAGAVNTSGEITNTITDYFLDTHGETPNIQCHTHPAGIGGYWSGTDKQDHAEWLDMRMSENGQIHFIVMHGGYCILARTYAWDGISDDPEADNLRFWDWRPRLHGEYLKPESSARSKHSHKGGYGYKTQKRVNGQTVTTYYPYGQGHGEWGDWDAYYDRVGPDGLTQAERDWYGGTINGVKETDRRSAGDHEQDELPLETMEKADGWRSGVEVTTGAERLAYMKMAIEVAKQSDIGEHCAEFPTLCIDTRDRGARYLSPLGLNAIPLTLKLKDMTEWDWERITKSQSARMPKSGKHVLETGVLENDVAVLRWYEPLLRALEVDTLQEMYTIVKNVVDALGKDSAFSVEILLSDEALWVDIFGADLHHTFCEARDNADFLEHYKKSQSSEQEE